MKRSRRLQPLTNHWLAAALLLLVLSVVVSALLWPAPAAAITTCPIPLRAASTPRGVPTGTITATTTSTAINPVYRVIGWNDLGMHCMNETFANLAVLPPYNTLWAQVVRQGPQPEIVTTNVTVAYDIVDNTYSAGKTDFWQYAQALFGVNLPPDVGLTGATLAGDMHPAIGHFTIEGIPLTPYRDIAPTTWYPYQLARLVARDSTTGQVLATTTTVAPVSTEMRCDTCHYDGAHGISTGNIETNILALHDDEENTNLMGARPVLCANCHGSNALGLPGDPELPNLSQAIHEKHAPEDDGAEPQPGSLVDPNDGTNDCYLCHPGQVTQCLRDVMYSSGMRCMDCHGGTAQVADPTRRPWIDEPQCGTCHGTQFAENPNTLYRNSTGHGGMYCEACHGSPHAILPTIEANDNIQNITLQGHAGTLETCQVCHGLLPPGRGPHGLIQRPDVCAPVDLVRDPGFEISPPNPFWHTSSNVASPILTNAVVDPHGGSWVARLGAANNAQESAWHPMTVPVGLSALRVSYWWRISTSEGNPTADNLAVQIRNASAVTLQTLQTLNAGHAGPNWQHSVFTLTQPYAGQTIQLAFVAQTNASNPTTFLIDDVDVVKVCANGVSGDITGDCLVTVADVQEAASHWMTVAGDACFAAPYDQDGTGEVDVVDIMLVAAQWEESGVGSRE